MATMSDGPFRDRGQGRRRSRRRNFQQSAKVLAADAQWDGFIVDISNSGAQVELFDTQGLPDKFSLVIGGPGGVRRLCEVVWRSQDRVGVTFERQQERLAAGTAMNALQRKVAATTGVK